MRSPWTECLSLPVRYVQGTYYEVGLGACGVKNVDSDFVVALTEANYAGGSHCGKV